MGIKNQFDLRGDIAVIKINDKNGMIRESIIDIEDFERIKDIKVRWFLKKNSYSPDVLYATSYFYKNKKVEFGLNLHHAILGVPINNLVVDHINGNQMDNRKSNLRIITHQQNMQNRKGPTKKCRSGIRGVHWDNALKKWRVRVTINKKSAYYGIFTDKFEAEKVAIKARSEIMQYSKEYMRRLS